MAKFEFTFNGITYGYNESTDRYSKIENGKTRRIGKIEYAKAHDDWMETAIDEYEKNEPVAEDKETAEQGLTFEELMNLAKKHYNNGGDGVVECWDENTYNTYIDQFGPITEKVAFQIFGADADDRADAEFHNQQVKEQDKKPAKKRVKVGGMEFAEDGVSVVLTDKQVKFVQLLPTSGFWDRGVDSSLWVSVLCDELAEEMGAMTIGAMISTLREKGLLVVGVGQYGENVDKKGRKEKVIAFTELGRKVAAKVLGL